MTTLTAVATSLEISPEFQQMLDDLDERVGAVEFSQGYAASLTPDEWLELPEVLHHNDVPLRVCGALESFIGFAA